MVELAEVPLFAGLSPVALARLVGELDEQALAAGAVVFRQGDPGDCLYVVRDGLAEARAGASLDGEYPLAVYEAGDTFGESALLTDEPRSSTVVALTELRLWALRKQRFLELIEQMPGLALAVGRTVSRRLQATHQAVSQLRPAFDPLAEREYLALDPELQRFLRRSAPLHPVRADLVARALGRPDAAQVLAYLEARLPFVSQEGPGVYRYHQLFRELLNEKLVAEQGEQGRRQWLRHLALAARSLDQPAQAQALLAAAGDRPPEQSRESLRAESGDGGVAELDELVLPLLDERTGRGGRPEGAEVVRPLALRALRGLRRVTAGEGALAGRAIVRPLGLLLSLGLLSLFWLAAPPPGLTREAFLALGLLAAALPLLVFGVLADHYITLLMAAAWAALGLVPARVALSGFASPGWFLVLAVLAVGVALSRSGLLYRLVLTLLALVPPNHVLLTLALAGVGVLFSPAMPNATARTALAAPLALELADALGYVRRSRGSAAIGMAMLLGFGQMCSLFLTGSSSGLLVHSLLPAESRAQFGFVNWFLAALPLHLVIFGLSYLFVLAVLRPEAQGGRPPERLAAQRRVLGPVSRAEWVTAAVFTLLLASFVLGPTLRLEPAWAAVVAMVVLGSAGVLDQQGFRNGVNWSFLLFFGVMLSLAEVFSSLKVDAWLAGVAAGPLTPLADSPALFLVALALAGYVLNLAVRWQAACVLMTLVLVPAVQPLGFEPWVIGMTALVTTNMWFLPYQSTIYQALYYGSDEQSFSHAQARPVALFYGLACLLGLVASVPYWRWLGLLPG